MFRKIVIALSVVVLSLGAITYIALEASDVAIAHTISRIGEPRATHIWFIETDHGLILEAGHPDNPWITDLHAGSTLHVTIDSQRHEYETEFQSNRHTQIREEMRRKYGWRDVWVGFLFDVSKSQRLIARKVNASPS